MKTNANIKNTALLSCGEAPRLPLEKKIDFVTATVAPEYR